MELQRSLDDYKRSGIAVFAVSYDPVEVLQRFTQQRGIEFPLLSDVGSRVIRELGLYNVHIVQQQAAFGFAPRESHFGLPYPGTFVLDEAGVVRERWFDQSYRVRPTAVTFLEESFGATSNRTGVRVAVERNYLRASATLGTSTYHPYQLLNVNLDLNVANGMHVYTHPIPDGYIPLSLDVEAIDGLDVRPLVTPPASLMRLDSLDETFHVLDGQVHMRLPVALTKNVGDVDLVIRLSYQVCSDRECYMPESLTLKLPLKAEDNVRD